MAVTAPLEPVKNVSHMTDASLTGNMPLLFPSDVVTDRGQVHGGPSASEHNQVSLMKSTHVHPLGDMS